MLNLNNLNTKEELEAYKECLEKEVQRLKITIRIEKFKLKLDQMAIENGTIELDKKKVILQMQEDGSMLEYVGSKFQNDYDVVLEAVKTFQWALCYASVELQNDYEVVYQALQLNPDAIEFASDELKKEDEFVKIYINHWVGEYKIYKDIDEFLKLHTLVIDKELIINFGDTPDVKP